LNIFFAGILIFQRTRISGRINERGKGKSWIMYLNSFLYMFKSRSNKINKGISLRIKGRKKKTKRQGDRETKTQRHRETAGQRDREKEIQRVRETERQRGREAERQRDRDTERQRDRGTEKQRNRETERQRD
jgi:hypothetical protein